MNTKPPAINPAVNSTLKDWKAYAGRWIAAAIGLAWLAGLLIVAQAYLLASIINDSALEKAHLESLMWPLGLLLVVFLGRALLTWLSEQAAFQAATQVKLSVRQLLYERIQQQGGAWLTQERSGELVTTLSDGVEALEAYYARYLPAMTLAVMLPLALLVFVFPADWLSGLVLLGTAPLIPLFMMLVGKGTEKRNQQQWQTLTRMSGYFLDMIQGLTTLKLFNASRNEAQVVAKMSEQYRQTTMSVLRVAFLSAFVLEFFASVSIAIVAVLIGFRLFWGEMQFFYGFFVLLLAPEFYLPLRNLGAQYHARMQAIGAADKMLDILNAPLPTNYDAKLAPPPFPAVIRCVDLYFSYPDGRTALKGVNLHIPAGKTTAIVGSSGAGKSTILQLLMGFLTIPAGQIQIGGVDLASIDPVQWRQRLAWLPQKPHLFPGSVAYNIALGGDQTDLPAIQHAAQQAQAHDFIQSLPQGYDTLIGEGRHGLSGGQVQRLALARAFYKPAPLVLLDEATAHLDKNSEILITTSLERLKQNRTLIMIAHRLATVEQADQIIVMAEGRVIASGTHTELKRDCVIYQRLLSDYLEAA